MRVEPVGFTSGRLITSDIDVVYTAFDDAGNTAECVVKLRIPGEWLLRISINGLYE